MTSGTWTIFKKEVRSYLHSPVAYVMAFVFLILCGYFFQESVNYISRYTQEYPMRVQQAEQMRQYGMQSQMPAPPNVDSIVIQRTYSVMSFLLIFIAPILTMRIFSEEYRGGTIELLWTSPVSSTEILVGKFLGSLALYAGMLSLTLVYIGVAYIYTDADAHPDIGIVASSYLGMMLMGATFISIGIFASSLTENQIVAAVISFSLLLFFLVIGAAAGYVGNFSAKEFLAYISFSTHIDSFIKGVIVLRDIVYYVTFTGFMLFLTNRVLESRRWRL
jgi:ABC-2 type transport system permease protein